MSGFIGVAECADQALAVSATETLIQIVAPTNHRLKVLAWGVFFSGVVVTNPSIRCELVRQSTAGTSSANTPKKWDDSLAETLQTTARDAFTVEPTTGDVLDIKGVHPQSGYEIIYPLGQEPPVGGGDRMGVRVITPAGVSPTAKAYIRFDE